MVTYTVTVPTSTVHTQTHTCVHTNTSCTLDSYRANVAKKLLSLEHNRLAIMSMFCPLQTSRHHSALLYT